MLEVINFKNKRLFLLDQRKLPEQLKYVVIRDYEETAMAIKDMVVRGAPAIGITGVYGYCLGCIERGFNKIDLLKQMSKVKQKLLNSRPTAVNLRWALDKMEGEFNGLQDKDIKQNKIYEKLVEAAHNLKKSEIEGNRRIGQHGAELLKNISREKGKLTVLTHCNAGALATGGWGTALGIIHSAFNEGLIKMVYVDETRPRLQGAKLTCFELKRENIPHTLICDSMSGLLMSQKKLDAVIVGADRIAANGDVANKIGTYIIAVLAHRHNLPFYVAAPKSTFDFKTPSGEDIEIEQRSEEEVLFVGKESISPKGTKAENPAFDVTPHEIVTAYITEEGTMKTTRIDRRMRQWEQEE